MYLSDADLALFADASGDHNPLHTSARYARSTPFGRQVAHGVLAAVAALDEAAPLPGPAGRIDLDFRQPTHPGVRYDVVVARDARDRTRVTVLDGDVECLSVTLTPGEVTDVPHLVRSPRERPRIVGPDDLVPGFAVTGPYGPDLGALCDRWPGAARLLGRLPLACLLWSSFVAGMELPGRDCLLNAVSLRLHPIAAAAPLELSYEARVDDVDPRFGLLTSAATLSACAAPVATASVEAMVRSPVPPTSTDLLTASLPLSDRLRGHTSVVVGGSRGLGAALVLALAGQGGRVLVGHRGTPDDLADLVATGAELGGEVESRPGDATTPEWSARVADTVGAVDLLVCCAAPPIRALRLDPAGADRVHEFVANAFALVSAPLAGLLGTIGGGRCLVVSSSAVTDPPADWPHYVAAKHAVEGLAHWAAATHPGTEFFVTRPGMLLTEQMNTPGTREKAGPVEPVAAALVRRLADPAPATRRPETIPVP